MNRKLNCPYCGNEMKFMRRENIQLGKTGWIIGDWGNLLAGALDVAIYCCPGCGKLELFRGDFAEDALAEGSGIAQIKCSVCGVDYEMDSPKCPRCGVKNDNW